MHATVKDRPDGRGVTERDRHAYIRDQQERCERQERAPKADGWTTAPIPPGDPEDEARSRH